MKIEQIEKMAKEVLEKNKSHYPEIILEIDGKTTIMALCFGDDDEKDMAKKAMRLFINSNCVENYFLIMEGWFSAQEKGAKRIRPRDDPKRQSALIIQQFSKDQNNKMIINVFEIKDNKVVYIDRTIPDMKTMVTDWNFYLEEEGIHEHMDRMDKDVR